MTQSRDKFGSFGRVYLAAALILTGLVLYLVQAAHVTETSYRIQRLQSEQADLLSQQEQLRYREAALEAPARLQQTAQLEGFQRAQPVRYLARADLTLVLGSDMQVARKPVPGWQNLLAALLGTHDAAASGQ